MGIPFSSWRSYVGREWTGAGLCFMAAFVSCAALVADTAFCADCSLAQHIGSSCVGKTATPNVRRNVGNVRLVHGPYPRQLQFSADGSVLISLAETIRFWSTDTGELLRSIEGPTAFHSFAQLRGGRYLVTIDDPDSVHENGWYYGVPRVVPVIRVWDSASGMLLAAQRLKCPANAANVRISAVASTDKGETAYCLLAHDEYTTATSGRILGKEVKKTQRILAFRGKRLDSVLDMKTETEWKAVKWDGTNDRLLLFNDFRMGSLEPESGKMVWERRFGSAGEDGLRIAEVVTPTASQNCGRVPCAQVLMRSIALEPVRWIAVDLSTGQVIGNTTECKTPNAPQKDAPDGEVNSQLLWTFRPERRLLQGWGGDERRHFCSISLDDELWEARRQNLNPASGEGNGLYCIASTEHGGIVAVAEFNDEAIHLFNVRARRRIASPTGTVTALTRTNRQRIGAVLDSRAVVVLDSRRACLICSWQINSQRRPSCLALSADGTKCAVGNSLGSAVLWDLTRGERLAVLPGPAAGLASIAITNDTDAVIAGDTCGRFWKWQYAPKLKASTNTRAPTLWPNPSLYSEAEGDLAIQRKPCLRNWRLFQISADAKTAIDFQLDSATNEQPLRVSTPNLTGMPGDGLSARIDTTTMESRTLFGDNVVLRGRVRVLRAGTEQPRYFSPAVPHQVALTLIHTTFDGQYIQLVFDSGQVTIIDIKRSALVAIIHTNDPEIVDVAYHPERNMLLVASFRGLLAAWSTDTLRPVARKKIADCRLAMMASRPEARGFDVIVGTRDAGVLILRQILRD